MKDEQLTHNLSILLTSPTRPQGFLSRTTVPEPARKTSIAQESWKVLQSHEAVGETNSIPPPDLCMVCPRKHGSPTEPFPCNHVRKQVKA